MRTIGFLLYKEFRQIFRNKALLPILFVAPIIQLIVLAYAANFEVKGLKMYVVDHDRSTLSQRIYGKFSGSPYFEMAGYTANTKAANTAVEVDKADIILEIPKGFERDLFVEKHAQLQLIANAIDGTKGGLGVAYAGQVIRGFNQEIVQEFGPRMVRPVSMNNTGGQIDIRYSHWYNPNMDYKTFMVPGILALLVTMVGAFLSSMNIVREKEMGTIEQINVSPIQKHHFIIGKLLPFWIIALVELSIGLIVAKLLYNIPFLGSLPLLFGFAALYMLVVLGMGLFISTVTETQQQAMFISWFFLVIFIFLSGMFTAIENMPTWAQQITYLNPVRYFIEVIRMVMLKGSGLADITNHIFIVAGYALAINGLAIWNYRKTV